MLDENRCYAALGRRDPVADGQFFVAVRTTRIYCRPICPARVPLRRNVMFFPTAAQAQEAGFRPCLRCRPESAPNSAAWMGSLASINRALRLIDEGALVDSGAAELAARLGMSARHLRRLFDQHLGVAPLAVEQARRVGLAKQLLHETTLGMTEIAFAAGFGSVRRFNEVFRGMFGRAPSSLRRGSRPATEGDAVTIQVWHRPSFDPLLWCDQARAAGHRVEKGRVELHLLVGGAAVCVDVTPSGPRRSSVTLSAVPIRLLARTIAQVKLLMAQADGDRTLSFYRLPLHAAEAECATTESSGVRRHSVGAEAPNRNDRAAA